jgi:hypothetical protein
MKIATMLSVSVSLLALLTAAAPAETTYLNATFDDKPIDTPIGTGGAAVGEPVSFDVGAVSAIVRQGPTPTRTLEIRDTSDYFAGAVQFEFLGSQELNSGFLSIALDLWFHELGDGRQFFIFVREQQFATCSFADIRFYPDGNVALTDHSNSNRMVGTYVTGKRVPVVLNFYLDAGTYDVWLDGAQVVFQQAHGVSGCGIGSVWIGSDTDADLEGVLSLDDIKVTDFHQEVASAPMSWGQVRSLYR